MFHFQPGSVAGGWPPYTVNMDLTLKMDEFIPPFIGKHDYIKGLLYHIDDIYISYAFSFKSFIYGGFRKIYLLLHCILETICL